MGFVLFIVSDVFDSADGQLARLRGTSTRFGRIIDGLSDNARFLNLYAHLLARLVDAGWVPAAAVALAISETSDPRRSSSTTRFHFFDLGRTPSRMWPISHRPSGSFSRRRWQLKKIPSVGLPGAYLTNVLVKLVTRKSLILMVGAHGLEPWTR